MAKNKVKGKLDAPNSTKAPLAAKILVLDLETAPVVACVWGLWKQNIGLEQINSDWYIMSYAAKWLGEKEVFQRDQRDAEDPEDDIELLTDLWHLINEADVVVAHNGKRFDIKKMNARFILRGFTPPSPYRVVDTLETVKRSFAFTSNKLAFLTDKLCKTHKKQTHGKFPGFTLWKQCLLGNLEAWDEMASYNVDDVLSLEELYFILRPWTEGHPNVAIYENTEEVKCPKCGSADVNYRGYTYTQSGRYRRVKCMSCGGWSRTRYTDNSTAVRKAALTN